MNRLPALLASIEPTDERFATMAEERHNGLAKPPGSLGRLERLGARLSAIDRSCPPPAVERPGLLIAAGDHGVHVHGVSPWPQEITTLMIENFCSGRASANAIASACGVDVAVLDAGAVRPPAPHRMLSAADVRNGTADLRTEPAMTETECTGAILAGAALADRMVDAGVGLLALGDMGIANTTPSAALIAAYTGERPERVTGRGTGIDDATLARKVDVVADALDRHGPDRDPLGVLASLGGLEHAALAGAALAAAARRLPVVLDGVNTVAAALAAAALCPTVTGYLIAGHRSVEPGASIGLAHLGLEPLLDLELRLGEGTGALLAIPVIRSAAAVLRDVAGLDELGA
ncbi:nicotinate-nucleotide--dimethylbenzimidazole phosphoribosyltransferase [Glycomyces sp. TRM65418]|uniref:nicotinate-nucleotide--dimethylbenzimidazole phosphoribosyltransferase n=1 Tax=Glycomyces sp. TRM65418 TaxID=2867006 RepID=UPI001CE4D28A|nr:nicotinate-nucleotide--dimethylbenzimidazole phosphoribosyltransferase [Glycomyces sp. TRM65418]MCC3764538.1 nicotinate-nucleotide--dimethylbenzimidazole phosphoribosyltransferase [Glycomyces sp. TRM65418]QZD54205.1 nicotinate-nucleotide--dimethylbenzimidazole phosphoribosyltransferase [Glycomyces sp. TRM65418]